MYTFDPAQDILIAKGGNPMDQIIIGKFIAERKYFFLNVKLHTLFTPLICTHKQLGKIGIRIQNDCLLFAGEALL